MVNLVIMRHGEAEPLSSQDSQRQLTAKGRAEVSQMAQWLSQHYQSLDWVVCSPFVRTRQTAELMLTHQNNNTQFEILPELVPEGDCHQVQLYIHARLEQNPDARFLLVSHMPLVSFLVETFTKNGCTPVFETSGLVCIDYRPPAAGKLLERMAPSDLKLITAS
ncbi:phosphohistidine phosphatase SixA [Rheinheimera riviphila]|uniref:Phosphohistidine phosphatase SixA n=1 Tax=Rheinheimera riviphila TaxID=1834037 RepID=A0A437QT29_9GAMM|nr:phosphohistidine phosphatase SixA [Rheinheimera riviphila]RVU37644.1 phosphohistidine phosphatase SixA [Rheinheimera riviphila]